MAALELLQDEPRAGGEGAAQLLDPARGAQREGPARAAGITPVIPLVIGDAETAVAATERALGRGVFAQAIRPPTVPAGTSRLRLTVMASHTKAELREAASTIAAAMPAHARKTMARHARRGTARRPTARACSTASPPEPPSPLRGLFVTGTDTGVGKSVLAAAICAALVRRGERVAAFKPVVTGHR